VKSHYVYKITNTVNGKIYIGKSIDPKARWRRHVSAAKTKSKAQFFYLQASINKYGEDCFSMEIIDKCETAEEAYNKEIYWISHYNSNNKKIGMNLTAGGDGTLGHTVSAEAREKMSKANKGRKMPEWLRQKIIAVNTGIVRSEETRKKMSVHQIGAGNHRYGKHCSEEQKKIISARQKGRVVSEETKNKVRTSTIKRFAQSPMSKESRQKISVARIGKPSEFGEQHHAAKLKEADVILIRKLASEGISYKVLSDRFGVKPTQIGKIVKRQRWAHVP
jgi:group I intron endonuclease